MAARPPAGAAPLRTAIERAEAAGLQGLLVRKAASHLKLLAELESAGWIGRPLAGSSLPPSPDSTLYYALAPTPGWRLVVLNTYAVSVLNTREGDPAAASAKAWLSRRTRRFGGLPADSPLETFLPSRFLRGLLPEALLLEYNRTSRSRTSTTKQKCGSREGGSDAAAGALAARRLLGHERAHTILSPLRHHAQRLRQPNVDGR